MTLQEDAIAYLVTQALEALARLDSARKELESARIHVDGAVSKLHTALDDAGLGPGFGPR